MNERIKQLAGKALDQAVPETWTTLTPEQLEKVQEKFAELVIAECARIARATPCPYTDDRMIQNLGHTWDMACVEAGNQIIAEFK